MEILPVICDVRSVYNVGSIFRTADAAGCARICLVGFTPSPFNRFGEIRPDFQKVALGAERTMTVESFKQIRTIIQKLKKEGFFIVALEQAENSIPYSMFKKKFPTKKKIALLLGNEPKGLAGSTLAAVDAIIEIPMHGAKESLNVSVAFGIAVFELVKKPAH